MPDLPNVGVERDLEQFKVSVFDTYKKTANKLLILGIL